MCRYSTNQVPGSYLYTPRESRFVTFPTYDTYIFYVRVPHSQSRMVEPPIQPYIYLISIYLDCLSGLDIQCEVEYMHSAGPVHRPLGYYRIFTVDNLQRTEHKHRGQGLE